jgi:hypothetical protein
MVKSRTIDQLPRQCEFVREADGLQCRSYAIEGSPFCNTHSVSPEELKERQRRGGRAGGRKKQQESAPPSMQSATRARVESLVRQGLDKKLPGLNETDFVEASVWAFIAAMLFERADNFPAFARRAFPADIRHRDIKAEQVAQEELNARLAARGYKPVGDWIAQREQGKYDLLLAEDSLSLR